MKYVYEAMGLITCVKGLYAEQMAHWVTHGQLVNTKGGAGNNCANKAPFSNLWTNLMYPYCIPV